MTATLALTIAPIFLLVVLGNLVRRIELLEDSFWPLAMKLGYWILLPSLLFFKISTAKIDYGLLVPFALVLAGSYFVAGALTLLVTRLGKIPGDKRASVLQGVVRHNSFMALAIAEALFGTVGLSLAALASAVLALVTNLSIIPALLSLAPDRRDSARLTFVAVSAVANPFVLSILAGLTANFLLLEEIPVLHDVTGMLGATALPLMLLCVGAGLRFRGLRAQITPLLLSLIGRFVVFPLLVILLARGLQAETMLILLIFAAVPTAPSSTALASQTGGNVPVMNAIVTVQTALAFLTLPLTLALGMTMLT